MRIIKTILHSILLRLADDLSEVEQNRCKFVFLVRRKEWVYDSPSRKEIAFVCKRPYLHFGKHKPHKRTV